MTRTLYSYTNDFLEFKAMLEESGLNAEDFSEALGTYEANIAEKMENFIKYHKELLALAEAQKAAAEELTKAAKAKEAKAESLKKYMDDTMKAIGSTSLQAGPYKLAYRKGSEVVLVDEDSLPKDYWVKQPDKPMSKPELKKLVADGIFITGVQIKRNPDSLVIKV